MNPWQNIRLDIYEKHMALDGVRQLQALHGLMRGQLEDFPVPIVMILGVAGGNGLDLIDPGRVRRVYGVDLNPRYLDACRERYGSLDGVFVPLEADLTDGSARLPHADLVIANLVVEYVGCTAFSERILEISPGCVSAVLQLNGDAGFVSASPYQKAFDKLSDICREVSPGQLDRAMAGIGYLPHGRKEAPLPNGKRLLRLDYKNASV